MIKFAGNTTNDTPVLGIGLSRENCDRLLEGQPIRFTTEFMQGIPVLEVFIMGGETEADMMNDMLRADAPEVRPADTSGAN